MLILFLGECKIRAAGAFFYLCQKIVLNKWDFSWNIFWINCSKITWDFKFLISPPQSIIMTHAFIFISKKNIWTICTILFRKLCLIFNINNDKLIKLVYTDTDTVSVRLPYWHSTGTDPTQTSYFMGTTTLRDTHSNME